MLGVVVVIHECNVFAFDRNTMEIDVSLTIGRETLYANITQNDRYATVGAYRRILAHIGKHGLAYK